MKKIILIAVSLIATSVAHAESVFVKYRGSVPLDSFQCEDITRSSVIKRVCYDKANSYLVLNLNGTYYHYCEVGVSVVSELLNASSMGKYYGTYIKGQGEMGPFDCRVRKVPEYGSNK